MLVRLACRCSCCCGCLPIAGLVAGALCSVFVLPTLLVGWTGLALINFPRNLYYAYYGLFGTKMCGAVLCVCPPRVARDTRPRRLACVTRACDPRVHRRLGCNLKFLLMLTAWLPVVLMPILSAIAAVMVGVVWGLVAPVGLIFSDDWTPCAHIQTTGHMVIDYHRASCGVCVVWCVRCGCRTTVDRALA